MAEPALLQRSPRRSPDDRLIRPAAGISTADPTLSLRGITTQLEAMKEQTPRGGRKWLASSVKFQLDRAKEIGLGVPFPE